MLNTLAFPSSPDPLAEMFVTVTLDTTALVADGTVYTVVSVFLTETACPRILYAVGNLTSHQKECR
jgi:hypothetical protein